MYFWCMRTIIIQINENAFIFILIFDINTLGHLEIYQLKSNYYLLLKKLHM